MKFIAVGLLLGFMSGWSYASTSGVIPHTFTPSATIFGQVSDSIEIRANQRTFITLYSVEERAFRPLNIPFDVASLDGLALDYRLTLPIFAHACEVNGVSTALAGVKVVLDGKVWPSEGVVFNGALNSHSIQLTYPEITQKVGVSQYCYGTVGVLAEVVSL